MQPIHRWSPLSKDPGAGQRCCRDLAALRDGGACGLCQQVGKLWADEGGLRAKGNPSVDGRGRACPVLGDAQQGMRLRGSFS